MVMKLANLNACTFSEAAIICYVVVVISESNDLHGIMSRSVSSDTTGLVDR